MPCYSIDLRKKVISQLEKKMPVSQISKLFNISRQTIYSWQKLHQTGKLQPRNNKIRKPQKVSQEDLEKYIEQHPEYTLEKIAAKFNCAISSIYYRIKKGKITYKKKNFCTKSEMKNKGPFTKKS